MKKYLDPKNLPYFGAIVQAVLFSIAGQDFFPRAGWLVGLGVGAVVNYSIALASSRINDIAERRKGLARLSLTCMLALSPATITLSLFMPASVFTAISWAVCVDLSIVLAGSITGKTMIVTDTPKQSVAGAKPKKQSAKQSVAQVQAVPASATHYPRKCEHCDAQIKAPQSVGAHMKKHHPELCKPKVLAENLFENVLKG